MATDIPTFVKDLRPFGGGTPISYLVSTSVTDLAQGEFVAWDSANRVMRRFVRDGSAGKFLGISRDSQVGVAKLGNQTALAAANARLSVFTTGVHESTGLAGETYGHGDSLFMNATSTQSVTKVSAGGTQLGTVYLPEGGTKSGAVKVPMLIDEYTVTQA